MKVLFIIVTFNGMKWIDRCLSCIYDSTVSADVFIVDNGSTDNTVAHIQSHYKDVVLIISKENIGFGKANNLGFEYALNNKYDYVYLLNQDAWIMSNTLEVLIGIFQNHHEYGLLSPLQMEKDLIQLDKNFRKLVFDKKMKKGVCPCNMVMAAHWLLKRETIERVGGFSPTFSHYGEDTNFCDRIRYNNYKIGIVPEAKAVHDRENRIETKEKKYYLNYVDYLIILSNPFLRKSKAICICFYFCCVSLFKLRSIKIINNIIKALFHLPEIYKNKNISKTREKAFLN